MRLFLRVIVGLCAVFFAISPVAFAQEPAAAKQPPAAEVPAISSAVQARTPNFTLSGDLSAEAAIDMISELERFRAALLEVHDVPAGTTDQVVDIYIIHDEDMFQVLGVPETFIAVYSIANVGPRVLVNGNVLRDHPERLRHSLRHEYVHHFNSLYQKTVIPKWMEEGLAEYYAGYKEHPDGQYSFGSGLPERTYTLTYPVKAWFPMHSLVQSLGTIARVSQKERKIPWEWEGEHLDTISLFYAQSWILVHYMMNQPGGLARLDAFNEEVITIVSGGKKPAAADTYEEYKANFVSIDDDVKQAMVTAFGEPEALPNVLQDYAGQEQLPVTTYTPKTPRQDPVVSIEELSELQALALQYRLLSTIARGTSINAKMKDVKARMEADPAFEVSLLISDAAQQSSIGANALGLENLAKALAIDPDAKDGQMLKVNMQFQELLNQYYLHGDKMRDTLRPVLATQPDNPRLLVMMAMTGQRNPEELPDEVKDALARIDSTELVRRHPNIALTLIDIYTAQEDYVTALRIARRGLAFANYTQGSSFKLRGLINDLERVMAEDAASPPE